MTSNLFLPEEIRSSNFDEDTENWFEILIQGNEYYRGILVVDKNGVCIASNSQMQVGVSYLNKSYVKTALSGEFVFSEPSLGRVTKNLSATVAAPVYLDGEVVGAVVMVNDFASLINYNRPEQSGIQSMFVSLLDRGGTFVTHRDKEIMDRQGEFLSLYYDLMQYRNGDAVEFSLEGKKYVGYARYEPISGWVIVSSGGEAEVFNDTNSLIYVVILVSLGVLCLISFLVIRVVNGVLNDLLSLIGFAKDVSEGNLDVQLKDSMRNDELGVLNKALQTLVSSMREMLKRSQEANRMKSDFLANMSHEIRTPLNAVIGMAHLYLANNEYSEKKRDYVSKIQIAARGLLGIINDILDISKIEAGMFELDSIPFNLQETMEQVRLIHQDNAQVKGLGLSTKYDESLPTNFKGDPVRLAQVLNNLVGNAIKFTERGKIEIRCEAVQGAGDGKTGIKIIVSDTGLGIDPGKIEALFKPFTQADASITRRFGGTGLGLAISDQIVKMMGGEFKVSSTINQGTVFSFVIRLEAVYYEFGLDDEFESDNIFRQLQLHGKRILVAEDNEINQFLMEEMLTPTGAEVVVVENGKLAVEAVQSQHFDVVLMDVQMPLMDGIQASREIRKIVGYHELPIIAVTANALKDDKEQGFDAGLNDYITKPIEPKQLALALKEWIK